MGNVPIHNLPIATNIGGGEYVEIDTLLPSPPYPSNTWFSQRVTTQKISNLLVSEIPAEIVTTIDGGGSVILSGTKDYPQIPFNGFITGVFLLADQVGSIIVDLRMCTYAQFDAGITHPVVADSICAGTPPTIVNSYKSSNTVLTGWTTQLGMSNILAVVVPQQATTITRVTVCIQISRNIP